MKDIKNPNKISRDGKLQCLKLKTTWNEINNISPIAAEEINEPKDIAIEISQKETKDENDLKKDRVTVSYSTTLWGLIYK